MHSFDYSSEKKMGEEVMKRKGWSLCGMTALVIGGTKGIGHAIVEELARFGATVHTCARNKVEVDQCLEGWKESGFYVTGSVCDVSVPEAREKLMEEVSSLFQGKLHIFVSNAGIVNWSSTVETTTEIFSSLMTTNFESTYHLSQLAHPLLKASGQGSIAFLSSAIGLLGVGAGSMCSVTKGAMNQLARNLACEWAKDNIRTNSVAPSITKTPMVADLFGMKETVRGMISRTPLGRFAEPEEVASLVAYFCLPVASYINGQVIAIDGGFTIHGFTPSIEDHVAYTQGKYR